MTELSRTLVVLLPADWEAAPTELRELRRCLVEEFAAEISVRRASGTMTAPLTFFAGYWPSDVYRLAQQEVLPLVQDAFFTLDWLNLDEVYYR